MWKAPGPAERGPLGYQIFRFCQRLGIRIFICNSLAASSTKKRKHCVGRHSPRPRFLTAASGSVPHLRGCRCSLSAYRLFRSPTGRQTLPNPNLPAAAASCLPSKADLKGLSPHSRPTALPSLSLQAPAPGIPPQTPCMGPDPSCQSLSTQLPLGTECPLKSQFP